MAKQTRTARTAQHRDGKRKCEQRIANESYREVNVNDFGGDIYTALRALGISPKSAIYTLASLKGGFKI